MRHAAIAFLLLAATPAASQPAPTLPTNGHPFSALPLPDGLVVSVTGNGRPGSASGLRVFSGTPATGLRFKCFQPVRVAEALKLTISNDGKTLLLAAGNAGLMMFDRAAVVDGCRAAPVVIPMGPPPSRQGTFDIAVTRDDRFAFVSNEYGVAERDTTGKPIQGNVAVVALGRDPTGTITGGRLVNRIATGGNAVTGVTVSPDGRRLYVTSEIAEPGARAANANLPILAHGGCRQSNGLAQASGILTIVDVAKAERGSPDSIVAATLAGCSPVRAVLTPDGQTVWVAARGDNRVLAFSASMLETAPDRSLIGAGDSGGPQPVGIALYAGGTRLAVANSNRFAGPNAKGNLALIEADPRRPKVAARMPATFFPRSVSVAGDGRTLFLTDYNGGRVQLIEGQ